MHRRILKRPRVTWEAIKKWAMFAIGCVAVYQILIFYISHSKTRIKFIPSTMNFSNTNTLVYMRQTNLNKFYDEQVTMEEIIDGDRNIFFLETAHIKNSDQINLNARQGCAVESAALMNPTMKVHLLIFCTESWNYSDRAETILIQLRSYKNIVIRHIQLKTYMKNSPMEEWWNTTNNLDSSYYFIHHMADILRYLTLWKFGGIYLDLDVVVQSSLEHLKSFAGAEDSLLVAIGALQFDATNVGRRYANACLHEALSDFRGDNWAYNGPGVITRTLKRICNTENIAKMTPDRCGGFEVFPPPVFYPIHYDNWMQYFDVNNKEKTMEAIENALAIHVWNKFSQSRVIQVGGGVPYELVAEKHCPRVLKNCGNTF